MGCAGGLRPSQSAKIAQKNAGRVPMKSEKANMEFLLAPAYISHRFIISNKVKI